MIWLLLAAHLVAIPAIALAGPRIGRIALAIGAIPTTAAAIWALTQLGSSNPVDTEVTWVEALDLSFAFRAAPVAALMALLVAGIGAAVFVYAAGYFSDGAKALGRFGATLMAFTTAMLGLVLADSVWTLFVFWELTSITSFLLVGHKNADAAVRSAARRALVITVMGGLALLAGLVVLVDATGTARLSLMDPSTVGGASATVAALLVVVAAATKSAQVPFHVWLPGAMAAPTPVSAYLHSATMVKAGVLLMAIASPVLSDATIWKPLGLAFGGASMLWGAIGALRHTDAKLILAWGTVSQLGLMVALLSLGTAKASFAAMSLLFAHACFKAPLFMIVGEIDVRTGTRDIDRLSGLRRSMPVTFAIGLVAGLSMAGVPPLLGFTAKEAAIEAVLQLSGFERVAVGAIVIGGSVLTVAYTLRFLVGVFGPASDDGQAGPTPVAPRRWAMTAPAAALGAISVLGFVFLGAINDIVKPAAEQIDPKAEVYSLLRWPGLTTGFVVSALVVVGGTVLGFAVTRRRIPIIGTVPRPVGEQVVDRGLDLVIVVARRIAGRVQHGSLPTYVVTMVATATLATIPFLWSIDLDALHWWDRPAQGALALVVVGAAAGTLIVNSRLGAALALGSVGIGVTGLFVVQGAPDLVLTQLLVETVVVVGFVVGLGHLARSFPPVGQIWKTARIVVSIMVGLGVAGALAASAARPVGSPPTAELTQAAVDDGGGNNIVNVILTDVRALDTVGEVVVLAVVALGVLALARPKETA